MKKLIHEIVFGRNSLLSGIFAMVVVLSIALGCNCGDKLDLANLAKNANSTSESNTSTETPDDGSVPSDDVVEGLVKETTADFGEAVSNKDFNELYDKASQDFQNTYTVDEMDKAFKSYTDKKSVVVPILKRVASTDAEFSSEPSIRSEKGLSILVAKGKFKTKPYNVRFDYEYVMRGGEWKLLKLVVNIP
ncbi:MAG: hypothetical protein AB7J13_05085 [Pyrinomonadaceae bacterium]